MDCMDPDVHYPKMAIKLNHSARLSLPANRPDSGVLLTSQNG